ncbi:hypothetical protein MTP99_011763 [Tenebrio molitor]|jgi:hypothetical protein|uniref:leucine-rich repeat-containing protein 24 n=1 Tax=Tenebrio molitor TaxID=7067 RepID=UPI0026FECC97|nr:hypothetical protein MTP99_011763 [Tenebrio molitor]
MKMAYRIIFLMAIWSAATANNDDWTGKCNKCRCVWSDGKRKADCTNINLNELPTDLSSEIREIDFSHNPLYQLGRNVLINAELRDIHKLYFQNCSITKIDATAFKGLALLIELDLSRNSIQDLTPATFRENLKLRVLLLNHNNLKRLDAGLFYNLTHLQKITLNDNEIEYINDTAFSLLPALLHLDFARNQLKVMSADFLTNLPRISSLNLEGNHWICDCHLEKFRNNCIVLNLITTRTECAEPPLLKGRQWRDDVIFACIPQILEPMPSTHIEATSSNVTLTCRVRGDPQPDVDWVSNGRIIDRDPRQNTQRFITSKSKVGDYTWNNLTITNVNYRDKGEYKCVAKNPGGVDETNVSLIVSSAGGAGGGGALALGATLPLIIALSVGAIVILVVILILICCCCKRNNHGMNSKRRDLMQTSSDECINLHHGQPEMEKALITDVNPVMKPPRVCSVPPSVNSGGTEVSDIRKNLLDSDSVFAGDDESRSFDFDTQSYRRNLLDTDYRGNHPYPPDLLPFPPRMCQVSPAGSSASTVADTSRLPAHHGPQSPNHSPLYESVSLYRTLPYSRSQSPFVGPPARVPRQGYVTIPRRPRQRWSGTETPAASSDVEEPLYDNLGVRTTVDGSSALSLNKIGEATTPKSIRLFPMSPTSCDPIAEHESVPTATTLPRDGAKLSPSRTQWAKANAEALRSPENRRNSMPDGKVKIAPVPPPKPKKRTSTGPLFEDEGEDGTEV